MPKNPKEAGAKVDNANVVEQSHPVEIEVAVEDPDNALEKTTS